MNAEGRAAVVLALRRVRGGCRGLPRRFGSCGDDAGMSTAEYAVGTVAACGFAAVLWGVVHSTAVQQLLTGLVTKALNQL